MKDVIVTVQDCRAAKLCKKGTRKWFKGHNLDFDDFVHNGISSEVLKKLNDAMAMKAVEVANGRRGR